MVVNLVFVMLQDIDHNLYKHTMKEMLELLKIIFAMNPLNLLMLRL